MDETHGDTPDEYAQTGHDTGRRTWSQGMPALRLGRRVALHRVEGQGTATTDATSAPITLDSTPPRFLRLIRFVVGVALLGLAWAGILAIVMLGQTLVQPVTRQHMITHLLFDVAVAGAACLIGITVLGCLIAGAFCLTLALTSRDWH
ncbi:MAG: hypothetical protein ACXWQR_21275 [Ktedonobacterales bacterium]